MYSYLQTPNVNQKRGREWSVGIIFTQVIDTFKIEIQMDFAFQSPITFPGPTFLESPKKSFQRRFFSYHPFNFEFGQNSNRFRYQTKNIFQPMYLAMWENRQINRSLLRGSAVWQNAKAQKLKKRLQKSSRLFHSEQHNKLKQIS